LSLTNYSNLKSALASALHRSDLTTPIPDFIALAEDKLNKRLRLRAMENRVTSSVSTEYVALPTGFLALRNIQLNSNPKVRLEYVTPDYIDKNYPDSTTGKPVFYTVVGGEIQLAPAPDGTYTLEMSYFKKLDIATDSTNWVLTNSPRAYYYGSLMEAAAYLKNDQRITVWSQLLNDALLELELSDQSDRFPIGGGLQMRTG
jgi:hypothetical protein